MVTDDNQFTISAGLELGSKNRYTNIFPFDSNRQPLGSPTSETDGAHSDYVNASYISYFDGPLYIATQGPLPDTVYDFWKMVWEHHSLVIVMLTKEHENGRSKCHHYWPDRLGESSNYADLVVKWEAEAEHPDDPSVVTRRFMLSRPSVTDETVHITHLHYMGWSDHGVPENPLGVLRLRQLARRAQAEGERAGKSALKIPIVVHCSAGCGRTGAFCVIDTWTEVPPREFHDDLVFMVVSRFRELRVTMVQTTKQFVFCHEAL
ncbi:receptor/non-receptor type protein-tyrosine phosphatase, partial [Martensiomyces pterosporus]